METKYWDLKTNEGTFNKVFATLKRKVGKYEILKYEFWFDDFEEDNYKDKIKMIFSDNKTFDEEKQDLIENLFNIKMMLKKQERKAKILFNKSGGTAKGTAITNRVTIPTSWVKELGITEDNRDVKLIYDGYKITIEKLED